MNAFITVFYDWSRAVASGFTWLAPLAVRVAVGVVFLGKAKSRSATPRVTWM